MCHSVRHFVLIFALGFLPLKPAFAAEEPSPIEEKGAWINQIEENPFAIEPHRPSYVLPYSYNANPDNDAFTQRSPGHHLQNAEVKFQISFRLPLWKQILGKELSLYAAYTQLSLWQAYNSDASSPFRDTNYEPEAILAIGLPQKEILGFTPQVVLLGTSHQSNGRGVEALSRSWNRIYADFIVSRGNFVLDLKPWYRIPEDKIDDNNPNIEKFFGYGELRARYKWRQQVYSLMFRNNLRGSENKGAVEVGWSIPWIYKLRWYVQYFNGYGESLLDYNRQTQRIGAGLLFGEWL